MNTKTLPTKQELHELFEYHDGELYWRKYRNGNATAGSIAGYFTKDGYRRITISRKLYTAHRLIYAMFNDDLTPELDIDHIDGNKSNNKFSNLRVANISQNMMNKSIPKNNTSGVKGVSWDKRANKWKVMVQLSRTQYYGGLFTLENLELAKQKAQELRNKLHGDFAHD